jgi:hypothetical protein
METYDSIKENPTTHEYISPVHNDGVQGSRRQSGR